MINESERMTDMKERYLCSAFDTQEAFASWKRREGARSFFRALTVLILIAGIVAAGWVWYINKDADGYRPYIDAGIVLGATLLLLIVNGIIRHTISNACRRTYDKYYRLANRTQNISEHIKREKVDPMLENQIVISIRSFLDAPVEFEYETKDNRFDDDDDYECVSVKDRNKEVREKLSGPVSSAIVYIDDVEVGAVDLDSEFSTFRVNPGLHALKIKIRKDYPYFEKSLELTTPVNPISVNGDYRVVLYSLCAKMNRGTLSYTLKTSEYDDLVSFMRDSYNTAELDGTVSDELLTNKLRKRARVLHEELYSDQETEEDIRQEEGMLFGQETVAFGDLAKKLEGTQHDARLNKNRQFEIVATLRREKN